MPEDIGARHLHARSSVSTHRRHTCSHQTTTHTHAHTQKQRHSCHHLLARPRSQGRGREERHADGALELKLDKVPICVPPSSLYPTIHTYTYTYIYIYTHIYTKLLVPAVCLSVSQAAGLNHMGGWTSPAMSNAKQSTRTAAAPRLDTRYSAGVTLNPKPHYAIQREREKKRPAREEEGGWLVVPHDWPRRPSARMVLAKRGR